MSSSAFSPTLTVTGGTSQQGEINIITNPVAQSNTSDWTTSNATLSRVATGSPLDPEIPTGFQAVSTTTTTSYVQTALQTVAPSLRNRKLKVQFFLALTDSTSWKVDVFKSDGVTRYPLSTDSSAVTVIPALTGTFTTTFDMDTGTGIYVRFTRHAGAGTSTLNFTNLIVGPGIQPQGAVAQEWQTFTATISSSSGSPAIGNGVINARYRRVGDSAQIRIGLTGGSTTNWGTGTLLFGMGAIGSINQSSIPQTTGGNIAVLGEVTALDASPGAYYYGNVVLYSSGFVAIIGGTSARWSSSFPVTWTTSDEISLDFTVPISEWSGSGTVQLAQNDVEYVWNSDPGVAAGTTYSNSVYYGYGPSGTPFLAYNSATASGFNTTKYRVQFQTPIQVTDAIQLEVLPPSSSTWLPSEKALVGYFIGNTAIYGARLVQISSTQVNVEFGNAGQSMGGIVTVGNAGDPWSSLATNGWRWRVRKTSAGAAVGFGIVVPGTSAGLVSASGVPGNTTGNTIASGFVGETADGIESSLTSFTGTGVWRQAFAVTLQPGRYTLEAFAFLNLNGATVTGFALNINTTTATASGLTFPRYYVTSGTSEGSEAYTSRDINISTATTYYINVQADYTVATPRYRAYYRWTRIA